MSPSEILAAVAELRRARGMVDRTHAAFMAAKTPRQQQDTMDAQHAAFEHLHRLVGDGPGLISLLSAAELGARALELLENFNRWDDISGATIAHEARRIGLLPAARPEETL